MTSLFQELKRRKVFRVVAVYTVVAWLLIQVIDVVLPTFNAPQWVNQTIILVLLLGLPVAIVLAWAFDLTPQGIIAAADVDPATSTENSSSGLTSLALGFMALAVGFLLVDRFISDIPSDSAATTDAINEEPVGVQRTVITLNEGDQLASAELMPLGVGRNTIAVSKEGSYLAYVVNRRGTTQLYIRAIDEFEARPVAGTEGGFSPFFSPDEQWLGFLTATQIMKVAIAGGTPQALTDAGNVYGVSWGEDDSIIFSEQEGSQLSLINADGGEKQTLLRSVTGVYNPETLPDDRGILLSTQENITLFVPETGAMLPLIPRGVDGRYASTGHIVYSNNGSYMAVPFDLSTVTITGAAVPVVNGVLTESWGISQLAFSASGLMAYIPGIDLGITTPTWVNRNGEEELIPLPPQRYGSFDLSPDGSKIALSVAGSGTDVWTYDTQRATPPQRLTTGGNSEYPKWSKDAESVVVGQRRKLNSDTGASITGHGLIGGEQASFVGSFGDIIAPDSWTTDGRLTFTSGSDSERGMDLYVSRAAGEAPEPFVVTADSEWGASFSPEGNYVAYTSDESGQYQIYVKPYPPTPARWVISSGYGEEPVWSDTGDEIFYRRGNEWLSVPVQTGGDFEAGIPEVMFRGSYNNVPGLSYGATPDGQRFLLLKQDEQAASTSINIVSNWFEELKRLAPAELQ